VLLPVNEIKMHIEYSFLFIAVLKLFYETDQDTRELQSKIKWHGSMDKEYSRSRVG